MVDRLPSLRFLLELVLAERDKQLGHFDALDGKAGVVLGFAGLLATLAPDVSEPFRVAGSVATTASAALALWSFWPRRFRVLEPTSLRRYVRAEESFTQLTVLDTFEEFLNEGSTLLEVKARRLRLALVALALSIGVFAVGILEGTVAGEPDESARPGPPDV